MWPRNIKHHHKKVPETLQRGITLTTGDKKMQIETIFKGVINFHGLLLTIVEHNGQDYIQLKPIVEMLSLQWKSARISTFNGDNGELYGTCELIPPVFDNFRTDIGTKKEVSMLNKDVKDFLSIFLVPLGVSKKRSIFLKRKFTEF